MDNKTIDTVEAILCFLEKNPSGAVKSACELYGMSFSAFKHNINKIEDLKDRYEKFRGHQESYKKLAAENALLRLAEGYDYTETKNYYSMKKLKESGEEIMVLTKREVFEKVKHPDLGAIKMITGYRESENKKEEYMDKKVEEAKEEIKEKKTDAMEDWSKKYEDLGKPENVKPISCLQSKK